MNIIKPSSHQNCIVCGDVSRNPISLQTQFTRVSDKSVTAEVMLDHLYQGYDKVLHGGVISTLLDAAMTHCLFSQDIEAMTAELNVRFVKPVPVCEPIIIDAKLCSNRRGMYKLVSSISLQGEVLAKGQAKFIAV